MIIYKAEASVEGLADKIAKSTVISYEMPITQWKPDDNAKNLLKLSSVSSLDKTLAGANDSDLYYTKSVLVTTNWNKNDDVFDYKETWAARHTPTHKPTNVEHNEKKIVGHITDCWAMTVDGETIPDNYIVDDLPKIFHLVNGAVIYRGLRDEELVSRADELIEQIEGGNKYVSMECAFTNFDYAVIKDGVASIMERNESSAFLTKHLRAYGGTGVYENVKIGRLLRNITFSGKGYVDKPANPDSIIFTDTDIFDCKANIQKNTIFSDSGVYINKNNNNLQEINNMAENESTMQKTIDELTASLKVALDEKKTLAEKLAGIDTETTKSKIAELEAQLIEVTTQATTYKTSSEENQTKLAELQAKVDEMTKAQLVAGRLSILVEGGLEKEIAQKKVDLYMNLTDEQFQDIATDLTEAAKKTKEMAKPKEGCKSEETKVEDTVDAKVLEDVKVEDEPNLSTANENKEDETKDTRKELQKIMASQLGITLED